MEEIDNRIRDVVYNPVQKQIGGQVNAQVNARIWIHIRLRINDQVWARHYGLILNQVHS